MEDARELATSAKQALARGDIAAAADLLARQLALDPGDAAAWINLAGCRRALKDVVGALEAVDGALRLNPRNFMAHLSRASLLERQGKAKKAAEAYGVALTLAPREESLDGPTLKALRHGREVNGSHVAGLGDYIKCAISAPLGGCSSPEAKRVDAFVQITLGTRRRYRQEPADFYYPGLPAIEFYERDAFPWLEALELSTTQIREELVGLLRDSAGDFVPYIAYPDTVPLDQWVELNHSSRWGAFHLWENGERLDAHADRCPATMAAISHLPQPKVSCRSPAAMFSALHPHTRIPPHTGVANTRLVMHLPLIVPPECGFRVGAETRQWREGEAWVFDDTIEHEAWNDSDQVRAILICDIWNPLLSADERHLITEVMTAMDRYCETEPGSGL